VISGEMKCTPEEESLYDVVAYAIWGLSESCNPNKELVYGFLEDLADEEFPQVSGEPGWTISRYFLFEKGLPVDFSLPPWRWTEDEILDLKKLQDQGVQELFGIDHCDVIPRHRVYSIEVFWRAVRESLLAFGDQHPERWPEIEEGFRRFTELGAFPGRLSD
jgi:hypothetical protein